MKNIISGLIFWTIVLGILFLLATIAEILSRVVTIDMVLGGIYTMFFVSIIYLLKSK